MKYIATKGRRHHQMPSKVTISRPRDRHFNVKNGRWWVVENVDNVVNIITKFLTTRRDR